MSPLVARLLNTPPMLKTWNVWMPWWRLVMRPTVLSLMRRSIAETALGPIQIAVMKCHKDSNSAPYKHCCHQPPPQE
jgi:hypothetical protein